MSSDQEHISQKQSQQRIQISKYGDITVEEKQPVYSMAPEDFDD